MVGVPGKYKGCETCRRRRVKVRLLSPSPPPPPPPLPTSKRRTFDLSNGQLTSKTSSQCTNERPYCQKCITSGRECEGYERERVFITGTPESKGRVASHPRRSPTASSSSSKTRLHLKPGSSSTPELSPEPSEPSDMSAARFTHQQLAPVQPFKPAWEDYTTMSTSHGEVPVLMVALQVPLAGVALSPQLDVNGHDDFRIDLPAYSPRETPITGASFFSTSARCLVHIADSYASSPSAAGNMCAFLFEPALGTTHDADVGDMQRLGPQGFTSFPDHHFFARVYRPMAVNKQVGSALMNRRATFLSDSAWKTTPWSKHPKSLLDRLLDITAQIPWLLEKLDQISTLPATLPRWHQAQGLLQTCLMLEGQFSQWLELANQGSGDMDQPPNYWLNMMDDDPSSQAAGIPFSPAYAFKDGVTATAFLYYWMSRIIFHRCVQGLYAVVFHPIMDTYPQMWAELPPSLQTTDWSVFQRVPELAGHLCRGLDAALEATVQPDLLVGPMSVALNFYRDINAESQDGLLEILWLEGFRTRLVEKGRYVATVLQGSSWFELARF
ncbi:Fungal Zn(2)-Cys(6) binuclear cluster domain [Geosmithia morbida]|uniref:Fungal Zn(2)-Cys(6) binuclear cluster domain n=1 Tax=Geosmithia morbida TaxID=1094350 RepID=A0A9P5D2Y7_9HYPO|nr:Fungal Zn(2)-Cys(6) binuclear cluster domain [Geosmithia morbida]KAF4121265.1 Fungal Zn(2)-Cys(6) binuclear cluster domain [Geosmithia morbida]